MKSFSFIQEMSFLDSEVRQKTIQAQGLAVKA